MCEKLFFAIHPIPNAWFWDSGAPDNKIQTPKSLKNVTCKHACQKTQLLFQSWAKTPKWRPRNPPKINRNPSLEPQDLLPCAPKSPCIARWSPRCQIGRNKHAKSHVLGTKFDNIRAPIHRELKNMWRRNCVQTSASQHTFQKKYFKKHPTNYKLKVKGPAAWSKPWDIKIPPHSWLIDKWSILSQKYVWFPYALLMFLHFVEIMGLPKLFHEKAH